MPAKRIIACLDVRGGRVVKGTRFESLRDVGDPVELATRYRDQGADEIVVLDVSATLEERLAHLQTIEAISDALDIPLAVGGGVRSEADAARMLDAGADKVAINSAAFDDPDLLARCAARFGSQCVVLSIDARASGDGYAVATHAAQRSRAADAIAWAREGVARGAGELLVTAIDRDGTRTGFDCALIGALRASVGVPLIASGGAASAEDFARVLRAGADAALGASIFHDGRASIAQVKDACMRDALEVRA
jgi:cyclase